VFGGRARQLSTCIPTELADQVPAKSSIMEA
jgi:hypothetical protein